MKKRLQRSLKKKTDVKGPEREKKCLAEHREPPPPPALVEGPLEDESDVALLGAQLLGAEGAGGVESVRAVRQRDLAPEGNRLLRADMSAGVEGVGRRSRVHVEARLAAQPQRHVGPLRPAHGALPHAALPALPLLAVVPPVVVAVHVAALQVHPGLLLVGRVLAAHGGEGQRVEPHGALRAGRVDLLAQRLQVFEGGGAREALGRAPQQGGAAEVDERAVDELLSLGLHLEHSKTAGQTMRSSCFSTFRPPERRQTGNQCLSPLPL